MKKEILVKIIKFLLYAVLLTPLIFYRSFICPFIVLRVFVFFSLIEIIFALWLGLVIFHKEYRPRFTPLTIILGLFFILLIISSIFGLDWQRSLWSTQDRALGLVGLFHFGVLFLVLGSLRRELNWKNYFFVSFIISSVVAIATIGVGLKLINSQLFLEPLGSADRPGTFFGNSSFTASYIFFHIFIGLWLLFEFLRERKKIAPFLAGILILLNIWALFITETRGALLGVISGALFLLVYFLVWGQRNFRKWSAIFLALVLIGAGIFWFTRDSSFWNKIPGLRRVTPASLTIQDWEPRFIAWGIAGKSFLERPLLGFGFENSKYPFDRYYEPQLLRYTFTGTYWDKPHNIFLEYLVNAGVLGFLAYLGIFITAFYLLFKKQKETPNLITPFFGAVLIAYLVQNFFLFDTFGSYLMFFILLAFLNGNYQLQKSVSENKSHLYLKPIVVILLILISFLPIYFLNYKSLYANNRQYWGTNYFLNSRPELALEAYAQSLTTSNPYINDTRKEFASNIFQVYSQGIEIPGIEKVSAKVMSELAAAINNHPNDYFLRLTFANASMDFYIFNPVYLKMGEEQINEALKLSPKRQELYYTLAKIKVIKGEKSAALELMKKAVELDPEAADPHFYYGLTALEAGNKELGFSEIDKAKELGRGPQNDGEARVLGNYYGDAGDYKKAISMYLIAVGNQDDLDSWFKLGIVYFYSGDRNSARFRIKYVLDALPEFKKSAAFEEFKSIIEDLGL